MKVKHSLVGRAAFTRLSITEGFVGGKFASTELNIWYGLFDCEFIGLEGSSIVASVAKRLF